MIYKIKLCDHDKCNLFQTLKHDMPLEIYGSMDVVIAVTASWMPVVPNGIQFKMKIVGTA